MTFNCTNYEYQNSHILEIGQQEYDRDVDEDLCV